MSHASKACRSGMKGLDLGGYRSSNSWWLLEGLECRLLDLHGETRKVHMWVHYHRYGYWLEIAAIDATLKLNLQSVNGINMKWFIDLGNINLCVVCASRGWSLIVWDQHDNKD